MKLSLKLVDGPVAQAYSVRQAFLFGLTSGLGVENSRTAARLLAAGGTDPISRSSYDRFWSGNVTARVSGNISMNHVTPGLSGMAADVSKDAIVAIGATLTLPLMSAASTTGASTATLRTLGTGLRWLTAGSMTERGVAAASDFGGQVLFNPVTGADYDVTATLGAFAMPNRYFASGLTAGVNFDRFDGFSFDATQGITSGVFNMIGGRFLGSLGDGLQSQFGHSLSGAAGEVVNQLPNLPLKAVESVTSKTIEDVQR